MAAVIPFDAEWNNVGDFNTLYGCLPKNGDGNVIQGEHIGLNSHDNLIISDRLVATVGIENLAIIETKDVVLVASRSEAQQVCDVARLLKENDDQRSTFYTEVHQPGDLV